MLQDMNLPYLSEMMNWPGVLNQDPEVMAKIAIAHSLGKPVDGHAPGLRGSQAAAYIQAGISTDHECISLAEAEEKLALGMKILIRQGSAARNLSALHTLVASAPGRVMLCTDDCHPDTLIHGHINTLVEQLLALGHSWQDILMAAHYTPKAHYGLPIGSLQVGDSADFLVLGSLENWLPLEVYYQGALIGEQGHPTIPYTPSPTPNTFKQRVVKASDLMLPVYTDKVFYPIMLAQDGQLITEKLSEALPLDHAGQPSPNPTTDTILLAVANRYDANAPISTCLVRGFGLKEGAAASSVAHDSHNVVAVGVSAEAVAQAISAVMEMEGGLALTGPFGTHRLHLPIAGLMANAPLEEVAGSYQLLEGLAKKQGGTPRALYMLLSFMALLVIPKLKLSDRGLFDAEAFSFWE
jgi:adenine deaminase